MESPATQKKDDDAISDGVGQGSQLSAKSQEYINEALKED